jgi:hypothetical protein
MKDLMINGISGVFNMIAGLAIAMVLIGVFNA